MKLNTTLFMICNLSLAIFSGSAFAENEIIVQVNDTKIDTNFYDKYKAMRIEQNPALPVGKIDRILKEELVNRELLYQSAIKDNLEKNKDIAFNLKVSRQEVLVNAAMQRALLLKPVTEADAKKEYDLTVAKNGGKEFKARHIVVKTEIEANEVIEMLNAGKNFEKLATEKSTGPSNKKSGDLGWIAAGQLGPNFSKAITKMTKGTYSKTPVKTRFGWHIIKLENTRTSTPPEFKQVKERLLVFLKNRVLSEYVFKLRKSAKIKVQ